MAQNVSAFDIPAGGATARAKPLLPVMSPENEEQKLQIEYDWLTDGLLQGLLTTAEKKRLRRVEARLDDLDAVTPAAAAMRQKQDDVKQQLNALLEQARQIPNVCFVEPQ